MKDCTQLLKAYTHSLYWQDSMQNGILCIAYSINVFCRVEFYFLKSDQCLLVINLEQLSTDLDLQFGIYVVTDTM